MEATGASATLNEGHDGVLVAPPGAALGLALLATGLSKAAGYVDWHQRGQNSVTGKSVLKEEKIERWAGVAVFILGNEDQGGKIVNALGVRAEFDLAKEKGLWLVPIGCSGFMAEELWSEVMKNFDDYFPGIPRKVRGLMEGLGKSGTNPLNLVDTVVEIVKLLAKE